MNQNDNALRVRWLRDRAKDLHRMADDLTAQANALEAELSDRPLTGGTPLRDQAVLVLRAAAKPMHYKTLAATIEDRFGCRIRGVDPDATLLANLDREPRVRSSRPRSGIYELVAS